MKLAHPELSGLVLNEADFFKEWIIEAPELFSRFVLELYEQKGGEEGGFVLSDDEKEISISKYAEIIINPFAVDINDKRILNKLYAELDKISKDENMFIKTQELSAYIQRYLLEVDQNTNYILDFDEEIQIPALLKAVGVHCEDTGSSTVERLICYIKIMAELVRIRLFVFVNIRSFLTDEQIREIIREVSYQDVKTIFIENQTRGCIEPHTQYIIDVDKCEIF